MRWRQFHLSTAVLLMLTAAVLHWLNFRPSFSWDWAIVTAKQIRPLPNPSEARGAGAATTASRAGEAVPEIEFVDFRLGGTYSVRYGWPWTARYWSWDVEPMLVVHPVEIPAEWRQVALQERASDLTFRLPTEEVFDRVLPGERLRPIRRESFESFCYTGAGSDAAALWSIAGTVANALAAFGILLVVGMAAEWLLRRKDHRGRREQVETIGLRS